MINTTRLPLKLFPLKYLILLRCGLFLRSEYEKIVLSKERAEAFINDNLPGYEMKPVAGDGMCNLHSFAEGLRRFGNKVTLSKAKSSLRGELASNHAYYKDFMMMIME